MTRQEVQLAEQQLLWGVCCEETNRVYGPINRMLHCARGPGEPGRAAVWTKEQEAGVGTAGPLC